jgi:UPF0755 protein
LQAEREKAEEAKNAKSTKAAKRPSSNRRDTHNATKKSSNVHGGEKRRISRLVIASVIAAVVILCGGGYFYVNASLNAVNPQNKTKETINIPDSSSSQQVASILASNHLVNNATVFEYYTKMKGIGNFRSGYYLLSQSMTPDEIAKALEKGGPSVPPALGKITIPEGYTIDQMAQAFTINAADANTKNPEKSPFSSNDFLSVVKDASFISAMTKKYPQLFSSLPSKDSGVKYQLEGYLFPATYDYNYKTTAREIVEQMIAKMDNTLKPYYSQLPADQLTVNQLLSLSALVEREANTDTDRETVASVFFNRMSSGMPLQSNVALLYAEGKLGGAVTAADDANVNTSMNSPFNLYTNTGTGPGPVDNPGLSSISAVINSPITSYYYFVADSKTGQVYFARTLAQQNANIAQYVNGK